MPSPEEIPQKVGGLVPYFFYDLYGRILPGSYLLFGLALTFRQSCTVQKIETWFHNARAPEAIVITGIMFGACFLVGYLMSQATREFFWRLGNNPIGLGALRNLFGAGADHDSIIERAFESHFGFRLDHDSSDGAYLFSCGRLCEFAVAVHYPMLDAVATRVAAEELVGRSICVASVVLALANLYLFEWWALVLNLVLAVLAYRSYEHYRRKYILEKFQGFLVLTRAGYGNQGQSGGTNGPANQKSPVEKPSLTA